MLTQYHFALLQRALVAIHREVELWAELPTALEGLLQIQRANGPKSEDSVNHTCFSPRWFQISLSRRGFGIGQSVC